MSENENFIGSETEALVSFVIVRVTKEDTLRGARGQFVFHVWTSIRETTTSKNFKKLIVSSFVKESLIWSVKG